MTRYGPKYEAASSSCRVLASTIFLELYICYTKERQMICCNPFLVLGMGRCAADFLQMRQSIQTIETNHLVDHEIRLGEARLDNVDMINNAVPNT